MNESFGVFIAGIGSILFIFWLMYRPISIVSPKNPNLRRGVPVYWEQLSEAEVDFLSQISDEVVETVHLFSFQKTGSYIRRSGTEALIVAFERGVGTSFPYVGYVKLDEPTPSLEYRTSLTGFMFLIPFIAVGFKVPLVILGIGAMLYFNFRTQRWIIRNFLKRSMSAAEHGSEMHTDLLAPP